ncbi:hypothetical protein TPY_3697 [Sulfobacillus acidophilus TPY]|nr:hypothetical protein TPY_3697 [Sulfobacillus acidophilus TPY]
MVDEFTSRGSMSRTDGDATSAHRPGQHKPRQRIPNYQMRMVDFWRYEA